MTWAEQIGASIVLPADRVQGDGRNYLVLGEEIPPAIASSIKAGIVFYSGNPDLPLYGFNYWVFGISTAGALELVGYFYQWSALPGSGGAESFFRQTVLSIAPPVGVDKPPVLSLGYNPNYATYNEKGVLIHLNVGEDDKPRCRVRQTVASGTLLANTWSIMNYDTVDQETPTPPGGAGSGWYGPFSAYYAPRAGWYAVEGRVFFSSVSAGAVIGARIYVNSALVQGGMGDLETVGAAGVQSASTGRISVLLNAGDALQIQGFSTVAWGTRVTTGDGAGSTMEIEYERAA